MCLKRLFCYILLCLVPVLPCGMISAAETGKQAINPHWTGKYCEECHTSKNPQQKNALLQFAGDPIKLCDRCHSRACVTVQSHSIEVQVSKDMERRFPSGWPLNKGNVSCLTCHDALLQMHDDFSVQWMNPNFLRGAPYKKKTDFCFTCHPKEQFQKTNPHQQIDGQGKIIEKNCLVCHETVPNTSQQKGISAVSLKEPIASLCIGCHPGHPTSHRGGAGQLTLTEEMRRALVDRGKALQVELPLINDRLFCGTCHNPHEKGVIQRADAQGGAGEKYFLRLNGGYDLCVTCHAEKRVKDRRRQAQRVQEETFKTPPEVLVSHKPFAENRCRACHEVTLQHREKPEAVYLCFRQGCHKPEMLKKPYLHYKPVVGNCYACHESHASGYGKLLRVNEETQCYSCHPLFNDTKSRDVPDIDKERSNKEHREFAAYLKTSSVPEGNDCGFCHNMKHRIHIGTMAPGACSSCHLYVRGILQGSASRPLNVHQTFKEKLCSQCHDPHAGTYKYQLKKPPETYLNK
jgi:predicted CXXCH cytochrome family protein